MKKGVFGYLHRKRIFSLLKSALLLGAVLAVYFIALRHFGTNKNIFSILAAVGALPTGRSIVQSIMLVRAKGASPAVKEAVSRVKGLSPETSGYDLCLTAYETSYSLSHAAAGDGRVVGFTGDAAADAVRCGQYIEEMLAKDGLGGYKAVIFTDLRGYVKALGETASKAGQDGMADRDKRAMQLLYAISL